MHLAGPGDPEATRRLHPLGARGCCLRLPPAGWCGGLGHPEAAAPQAEAPSPPGHPLKPSFPRRGGKGNENRESKGRRHPTLYGSPRWMGRGGSSGWQPRPRPSLGRGRRAGLLLPRHGDGSLAVASVHARRDLGAGEGQHAVRGQGAGERRLVHIGRQAVAAVELTGNVAVVILGRACGRAQSDTTRPHVEKVLPDPTVG